MKKLLPISIQTFSKLREENCVYVDKTELIYKLTQGGGNTYFLSRPRRFGKSMTLSTLKSIYQGEKHLFAARDSTEQDLWIYDKWDWTRRNPVIHIPFNDFNYRDNSLTDALSWAIQAQAKQHDITLEAQDYARQFEELIQKLAKAKGKVVILIDEYDKPIIDYLETPNHAVAKKHRDILRQFYACLKSNDYNIELFFMTGVSKFSQTGIFSHLNHLKDITMDKEFTTLVGYTQEELVGNFDEYIVKAAEEIEMEKEELLSLIKIWYNGYSWDAKTSVYNPYSVLLFFQKNSFESHWYRTGSPKFLIDIIRQTGIFDFNKLKVNDVK
jgi:Predicted AAA-ATPase